MNEGFNYGMPHLIGRDINHVKCTRMPKPEGCFTNVSWALWNNLAKKHNAWSHIFGENSKLKLCTCAQSMALGTRIKFQLEILMKSTISAIPKFRENILKSSRNVSETPPRILRTNLTNAKVAESMVPVIARSTAAMTMTLCHGDIPVFINNGFQEIAMFQIEGWCKMQIYFRAIW